MQPGARGTLWWRALAWMALAAVFTATHWPNLQLDLPMRGSDKVLHAVAFMMLALVWWPTGFIRSVPRAPGCMGQAPAAGASCVGATAEAAFARLARGLAAGAGSASVGHHRSTWCRAICM